MGHTTWLGLGQPNGSSRFQPRCRAALAAVMCQAGGATSKGTGVVTLFCSARSSSAHRSRLAAASPSVGRSSGRSRQDPALEGWGGG
jgi:hypothetical protein